MTDDWYEFLHALLDAEARFLVVGAHALAVHGVPRATQDLDVWVPPTPENSARVWSALAAFGAPMESLGLAQRDFVQPDVVIQLGLPPNRIDIMTGLSGIASFDAAWATRVEQDVRGRAVPFLGRDAFVINKRASARLKDLSDLESLGEDPHA